VDRVLRIRGHTTLRQGVVPRRVLLRLLRKYMLASLSRGLRPYVCQYPLIRRYDAQGQGAVDIEVVPESAEVLPRVA
jgi:hypothetical protein